MSHFLSVPPVSSIRGSLRVPPSKSATNRALLLAALGESPVEIVGPLDSDDTVALRRCLTAMGASIERGGSGLRVSGPLGGDSEHSIALDAADSGTAARFLTAVCAAIPGRFLLSGSDRLRERPIAPLVEALAAAGARIAYAGRPGRLPLEIEGGLRSEALRVNASQSSQYLSAILLAAVAVEGGLSVRAAGGIASEPYVGMTLEVLRAFGHDVVESDTVRVRRGAQAPSRYDVPGDYSSAIPLLAAVGVAGGSLELTGLAWPSADADAGALPVLERMGIRIDGFSSAVTAASSGDSLSPIAVDASRFPDSVPALAALAALTPGESRFFGIGHLRLKESDRIASLAEILTAAGAVATAGPDILTVTGPARARGLVRLSAYRDHRMAMAAALLSLRLPGLLIEDPACVSKSYPQFFRDLDAISIR